MIKKARDIQLGNSIAGRVVRIVSTKRVEGELRDITYLRFLDGAGSLEVPSDTDVWIDDPVPHCNPETITVHKLEPVATYTRAEELKPEVILCLPILKVEDFGSVVKIWVHSLGGQAPLYYRGNDSVRYIKEEVHREYLHKPGETRTVKL